jgi:hypothetical protein
MVVFALIPVQPTPRLPVSIITDKIAIYRLIPVYKSMENKKRIAAVKIHLQRSPVLPAVTHESKKSNGSGGPNFST